MTVNGFNRIVWAARIKSAFRRKPRADGTLIEANYRFEACSQRRLIFFHSFFNCFCRCLFSASPILSRAMTTMSMFGKSCWCKRKLSRIMRLMRLRPTAVFSFFFAMVRPSLGWSKSLYLASSVKWSETALTGWSKMRENCEGVNKRNSLGKVWLFTIMQRA